MQNVNITFSNNQADLSGAAIYATDIQLCRWIGNDYVAIDSENTTIFGRLPDEIASQSPFHYKYVRVMCRLTFINAGGLHTLS